jgi:hypothetical protein
MIALEWDYGAGVFRLRDSGMPGFELSGGYIPYRKE